MSRKAKAAQRRRAKELQRDSMKFFKEPIRHHLLIPSKELKKREARRKEKLICPEG